jgi:hypothetical protein
VLKRSNASAKDELRQPTEDVIDQLLFQGAGRESAAMTALLAIGDAYIHEMLTDPIRLPGQMHLYIASSDPEIREVVRIGYDNLVAYAEQVSGLSRADLELPPHRHGAERPRLGAGAGRRGALDGGHLLDGCRRTCRGLSA